MRPLEVLCPGLERSGMGGSGVVGPEGEARPVSLNDRAEPVGLGGGAGQSEAERAAPSAPLSRSGPASVLEVVPVGNSGING